MCFRGRTRLKQDFFFHRLRKTEKISYAKACRVCEEIHENLRGAVSGAFSREIGAWSGEWCLLTRDRDRQMNNLPPAHEQFTTPGNRSFAATLEAGHTAQSTHGPPSTAGVHSFAATGNHVCLVTDTVFGIVPQDTVFPTIFSIVTNLCCAVARTPPQAHLYDGLVAGQGMERAYPQVEQDYYQGHGQTICENCLIHALLWLFECCFTPFLWWMMIQLNAVYMSVHTGVDQTQCCVCGQFCYVPVSRSVKWRREQNIPGIGTTILSSTGSKHL